MSMAPTIRPARWEDREAIVGLMEAMGGHDGARERPATWTNLAHTLRQSNVRVLVAERGGAVVGWIEVHRRPSPIRSATEAWIQSLCVAPEARGQRIGHLLVEAASEAATLLGADVLTVDTAVDRHDTHRFYGANGFVDQTPARRLTRPLAAVAAPTLAERFLHAAAQATRAVADALACLDAEREAQPAPHVDDKRYDLAAERAALAALEPLGTPILTEEGGPIGPAPEAGEAWIALDPIDGTRNYLASLPPWGISIALVVDERPVAGWVCDLAGGRTWWASEGRGAHADGRPIATRATGLLLLPSTDPTAVPALDGRFERLRIGGSTAIALCQVAEGAASAFLDVHRDICAVWDLAAAQLIVAEAGGAVVDRDGQVPRLSFDPERRYNVCAAHADDVARATMAAMTPGSVRPRPRPGAPSGGA